MIITIITITIIIIIRLGWSVQGIWPPGVDNTEINGTYCILK
jgi:hypothetical protein